MEFTVNKAELVKELSLSQGVVEKKTTIPILSNVLLEASGDRVTLTATDLELGIRCSCPARVKKEGAGTVPARKLLDYVRLLPEADVNMKPVGMGGPASLAHRQIDGYVWFKPQGLALQLRGTPVDVLDLDPYVPLPQDFMLTTDRVARTRPGALRGYLRALKKAYEHDFDPKNWEENNGYQARWAPESVQDTKFLKALRERLHLSQAVLASVLNTSPSTVRKWEVGDKKPSGPSQKLLDIIERKAVMYEDEMGSKMSEGEVPVGQPSQVAEHLVLRPVAAEHRVGEVLRLPAGPVWEPGGRLGHGGGIERLQHGLNDGFVARLVVGDAVPVAEGVLGTHLDAAASQAGERRGVGHVGVEDSLGVRVRLVHGHVDAEGGALDLGIAFDGLALAVHHDDVGGLHLAPVLAVGVEKVMLLGPRQRVAEMVVDAFLELVAGGKTKGSSHVDAGLSDSVLVAHSGSLALPRA